ncbi:MAG: hypothetical protein JST76_08575 [Bacteroidetes bacterium]|nr:hypothetical protein [Bacteroidota bacterium]
MTRRQLFYLLVVFLLLLAGRLCIAGEGYLEDPDELLYLWIHTHAASLSHWSTWVECMIHMQGQPPEIAIRLLEYLSTTSIAAMTHKSMLHADVLYIIGLYNIAVSLFILFIFFRMLLRLRFSFGLALTGTILLGTLFNYNLHIRHILPYDHAFLFQLLSLYLLLGQSVTLRTVLLAGLLSAIGLTNYYGSFMFIFINAGYIVLSGRDAPARMIGKLAVFVLPFIIVMLSYEWGTGLCGVSYFDFLHYYSGTVITGGSFDEGLIYLFLYFHLVEHWWGLLLLLLFFAGAFLLFLRPAGQPVRLVLALGIIGYLSFGCYVVFFHKMLFSGRVLFIYYPFIIIGVMRALQAIQIRHTGRMLAGICLAAFIHYGFVIADFRQIGYPRTVIYSQHLFEKDQKVKFDYRDEMSSPMRYSMRRMFCIDSTGPDILPAGRYTLSNFAFLRDVPDSALRSYAPLQLHEGDSILFEKLHFESHPAYTLEYCTRHGRDFYLQHHFKIRVIRTAAQP